MSPHHRFNSFLSQLNTGFVGKANRLKVFCCLLIVAMWSILSVREQFKLW